jgi:putative spermidine/putrescine transport system permease protein
MVSRFVGDDLVQAAANSFLVAAITTAASVVLAVPAALYLNKRASPAARLLDNFFMSPLILPALAFGLALVLLVTRAGFPLSSYTLLIGHVVVCAPFVLRTSLATLARLDPALLESSESLGASGTYTFFRVTLPSIRTGIMAGGFLAFLSSFDNIPVSLFLADARTTVLPIRMWQMMENNLDGRVAAISGIIVLTTILLTIMIDRMADLKQHLR